MRRSVRFKLRAIDHAHAKAVNHKAKSRERIRRDARMLATVKSGSLPFTPDVMSWLSRKLEKAASKITDADLKTLTA